MGNLILDKASKRLVENLSDYGDSKDNLRCIALRWSTIFKQPVSPCQVIMAMIDLKVARLINNYQNLDSFVDIAGYSALAKDFVSLKRDELDDDK